MMNKNTGHSSNLKSLFFLVMMLGSMIGFLTYLYLQNKELEKLANFTPTVKTTQTPSSYISLPSIPTIIQTVSPSQSLVDVTAKGFTPSTLKIKKDGQVTFNNKDNKEHKIISEPPLNIDEPLTPGSSISFILDKAGTYTFSLESDPQKLKETIIVE